MTTVVYRAFGYISISLCLITASCPVMDDPPTIDAHGTVTISDDIAKLGYTVESLQIYSQKGVLLETVPLTLEKDFYVWKTKIETVEGTLVTFWVKFFDKVSGTVYFGEGQNDIIASGSAYDWTVTRVYVPVFSAADLRKIGVDPHFLRSKSYILVSDINLAGDWIPLCSESTPFSGIFDGNSRTIRGLRFGGGAGQDIGLFGASKSAIFRNLTIIVNASEIELGPSHTRNVGFLAGNAQNTQISKITVKTNSAGTPGVIKIHESGGSDMNVGALVGCLSGSSTVSQSAAMIPLNISLENTGGNVNMYGGGLIGKVMGTMNGGNLTPGSITVTKCFVQGELSISLLNTPAAAGNLFFAGGLIGGAAKDTTNLDITESYSAGNVNVQNAWTGNAGGLIGGGVTQQLASTLTIKRSVALAHQINVSFNETAPSNYAVDNVAGQALMLSSSDLYYASPIIFGGTPQTPGKQAGSSEVLGTGKAQLRSAINVQWFGNQLPYGGLAWDFNSTWQWDAVSDLPVFQW